jgi:hypothetical protein
MISLQIRTAGFGRGRVLAAAESGHDTRPAARFVRMQTQNMPQIRQISAQRWQIPELSLGRCHLHAAAAAALAPDLLQQPLLGQPRPGEFHACVEADLRRPAEQVAGFGDGVGPSAVGEVAHRRRAQFDLSAERVCRT